MITKDNLRQVLDAIGFQQNSLGIYEKTYSIFKDYNVGTILWGIDGDWDVRYIPPQMPFYPTDHCGTLRVQATDVNARYLAFALHAEGERRRFTRTNRPSLDRKRLTTHRIPPDQIS